MKTVANGIRCVIFDLGRVVFPSPISRLGQLERTNGIAHNALNKYIAASQAWNELEKGLITPHEFVNLSYDTELAQNLKLFGASVDPNLSKVSGKMIVEVITSADSWNPRPSYLEAISTLRQSGLKVVALTNNFKTISGAKDNERFAQLSWESNLNGIFDTIVESSKINMRKPSLEIYKHTCNLAGVYPDQCVFLDDIGANLKPAKELGMRTIRVNVNDENGIEALLTLEQIIEIYPLFSTLHP